MIKSNELRLGNLFYGGDPARCIGNVLTIIQQGIEAGYQLIGYGSAPNNPGIGFAKYEDIYPIPLTEEWLERLGFENRCMRVDEYSGMRIDEKGRFELMDYLDGQTVSSWDHRIEFVHQLQNLFFALSGEELTIKQPE